MTCTLLNGETLLIIQLIISVAFESTYCERAKRFRIRPTVLSGVEVLCPSTPMTPSRGHAPPHRASVDVTRRPSKADWLQAELWPSSERNPVTLMST
ncbi:hypothetical protein E2C01_059821 [Portunus trituberculatus]|uniref:Secreted protein n=1 Tax=Portunus trituberculatus TaxID=210409 RepID=A0A5B7H7P1_PORTR|nr:hypothetical protein [Portunus trituberculatus]